MAARETEHVEQRELCLMPRAKKFQLNHTWLIDNFTYCFQPNVTIKSSLLQIPEYPMTAIIGLTRREDYVKEDNDVMLFGPKIRSPMTRIEVHIDLESDLIPVIISSEVSILKPTVDNTEYFSSRKDVATIEVNNRLRLELHVCPGVLIEGDIIKNGSVSIRCVITVIANARPKTNNHPFQAPLIEYSLTSDFKTLAENPKYSDITITVGSKKFHAHKLILSTRSSVFAAMFENEMDGNRINNIDIIDMTEEVVVAIELLDAAERYHLKNLKILCAQRLQETLNCDNAAERLIMIDRYNVKEMKDYILQFISANRKEVMKTNGYKMMEKTNPDLLLEALQILWLN